jgi:hypothetical protein
LDELLRLFGEISVVYEQYKNELEALRARIETQMVAADYPSGTYVSEQWHVTLMPESERRTMTIARLEQAIADANLTPEQQTLFRDAISTSVLQRHVRIRARNDQ